MEIAPFWHPSHSVLPYLQNCIKNSYLLTSRIPHYIHSMRTSACACVHAVGEEERERERERETKEGITWCFKQKNNKNKLATWPDHTFSEIQTNLLLSSEANMFLPSVCLLGSVRCLHNDSMLVQWKPQGCLTANAHKYTRMHTHVELMHYTNH